MARVRVFFYATVREAAGAGELEVEARSLQELLEVLSRMSHGLADVVAVNDIAKGSIVLLLNGRTLTSAEVQNALLSDGDEVAVFPMVSGG